MSTKSKFFDYYNIFAKCRFVGSTLKMINSEYLKGGDVYDLAQKQ